MARSKAWPDSLGPTPPPGEVMVTCGWCMTGHHDACQPSIHSILTNKTYVCECKHECECTCHGKADVAEPICSICLCNLEVE